MTYWFNCFDRGWKFIKLVSSAKSCTLQQSIAKCKSFI